MPKQMPFKDAQFGVVVMCEVVERLDDEILSKALLEVWRVLKPAVFCLQVLPIEKTLVRILIL